MSVEGIALLCRSAFEHVPAFGPSPPYESWQDGETPFYLGAQRLAFPASQTCGLDFSHQRPIWHLTQQVACEEASSIIGGGGVCLQKGHGGVPQGVRYLHGQHQRHLMLFCASIGTVASPWCDLAVAPVHVVSKPGSLALPGILEATPYSLLHTFTD